MTHSLRTWFAVSAAALSLLGLSAPSHAQRPAPSPAAESDLNASQKTRVAARKARFEKDIASLRADKKMTEAQKQAKFQTMARSVDTDLLAILSPEQRAQVLKRKGINEQFGRDLAALRTSTTMTEKQKKAKFQVMMAARQNALLETLPPAQRIRVQAEQQAKMARIASLRQQVEALGDSIQKSETPAQLRQIQAISQSTRSREQAVFADKGLSDQMKQSRIDSLRLQAQRNIDALLTPAQRAKFARLRSLISSPPQ